MKTLVNLEDKKMLLERLYRTQSDTPQVWSKMSAHQMVCHLCDSFRSKLGGKEVQSRANFFTTTAMKWFVLRATLPWPHGINTPPELDQQIGGTPPEEFEKDRRARLLRKDDGLGVDTLGVAAYGSSSAAVQLLTSALKGSRNNM